MAANEEIVAIGLLTKRELEMFGSTLSKVWPIEEAPTFAQLLEAIDDADREGTSLDGSA